MTTRGIFHLTSRLAQKAFQEASNLPTAGKVRFKGRKSKQNDDMHDEVPRGVREAGRPRRFTAGCGSETEAERIRRSNQGPCGFVGRIAGKAMARRPSRMFIRRMTMLRDSGSRGLVTLGRMHA